MLRQISHLGKKKDKFIVTVHINDVVFSNESYKKFENASLLNLCFEKDEDFISSKGKPMTFDETTKIHSLIVQEHLSLPITLYKDGKSNIYQEKLGEMILRKWNKEKDKFDGVEAFKIRLEKIIPELLDGPKDYIWPIDGLGEIVAAVSVSVQAIESSDE